MTDLLPLPARRVAFERAFSTGHAETDRQNFLRYSHPRDCYIADRIQALWEGWDAHEITSASPLKAAVSELAVNDRVEWCDNFGRWLPGELSQVAYGIALDDGTGAICDDLARLRPTLTLRPSGGDSGDAVAGLAVHAEHLTDDGSLTYAGQRKVVEIMAGEIHVAVKLLQRIQQRAEAIDCQPMTGAKQMPDRVAGLVHGWRAMAAAARLDEETAHNEYDEARHLATAAAFDECADELAAAIGAQRGDGNGDG